MLIYQKLKENYNQQINVDSLKLAGYRNGYVNRE